MPRGVFAAKGTVTGVTTAKTLMYIEVGASYPIEIIRASITAEDEDTSEQIKAELNRIATLGTPTATTITPKPTWQGSAAAGVTCKLNVTASEPTYDAYADALKAGGANKLAGWHYLPLEAEKCIIGVNDDVGLRLVDALATATDLTVEIVFQEIG